MDEYVQIHPEMQKKFFSGQILRVYCTILYSTGLYGTGYHPPTKVKIFSLHFWMNQAISNVFPKVIEKTQKNPQKSLELAKTPVWKFSKLFWFFFLRLP